MEHVRHENRSGITWPISTTSHLKPFREDDFSLLAVDRTRAALAAATVFGPADVEAFALTEPAETGSLVSSWHGTTFFASMNRVNAPAGM